MRHVEFSSVFHHLSPINFSHSPDLSAPTALNLNGAFVHIELEVSYLWRQFSVISSDPEESRKSPNVVTIKNLAAFDPNIHVKRFNITDVVDRNGLELKDFFLPCMKSAPHGEHVNFAKQNDASDPEAALVNHLRVNDPPDNAALFSYRAGARHRPLTKSAFEKQLKQAFKIDGIRIGSTVEYLLRGVPIDVMKIKGRLALASKATSGSMLESWHPTCKLSQSFTKMFFES
ncbi:hypothetical protein DFH07DRAFT_985590 [Mycena maculata]|uniref:Uncharacterized protein n=1 Tax=Mycena maculata TaxID=230809 RepID=A0AAD7I8H2_9AGAR|nr:hypothetical protein DFH07DRAFT_985590 [Mycena maculata]